MNGRMWSCLLGLGLAVFAIPLHAQSAPTEGPTDVVIGLLELVIDTDSESASRCLRILREKVATGELRDAALDALKQRLAPMLTKALSDVRHPLHWDAVLLAGTWGEPRAATELNKAVQSEERSVADRIEALRSLFAADAPGVLTLASRLLVARRPSDAADSQVGAIQDALLEMMSQSKRAEVADIVLAAYSQLPEALRPRAIELLTQRPEWTRRLLDRIAQKQLPSHVLHANQLVKLQASRDEGVREQLRALYGTVRAERNPQREKVIQQVREWIAHEPGDPHRGWQVFRRVCGQCHRLYGEGQDVGPDITRNGRSSLTQLLSNVLDPSLVIGNAYQARTVLTVDGRVLTGLVQEETPQRIVLKLQGGKIEVIPADDIEMMQQSPLSLMPEGLEQQLSRQELLDLFALLRLDKPPDDPTATWIPDTDPQPSAP